LSVLVVFILLATPNQHNELFFSLLCFFLPSFLSLFLYCKMQRWLCSFTNAEWANRHCNRPVEEDTHKNVFDHSDNNNGTTDDTNTTTTTNNNNNKDGRNSTEEEEDDSTIDDSSEEGSSFTTAPTPGPAFLDNENNSNSNKNVPVCETNEAGEFWVSPEAKLNTARTTIVPTKCKGRLI